MVTFIRKCANGLVIGLIGLLLQVIGYINPSDAGGGVIQSENVVNGVKLLFGVAPIVFILLALFFCRKYNLTRDKHLIIMKEINRIKEEGNFNGDKEDIKICEEITGMSYKEIEFLRNKFNNM